MTTSEWIVTLGGLAAIIGVNWYFFAKPRTRGVDPSRENASTASS
jgi:hypothetical protein